MECSVWFRRTEIGSVVLEPPRPDGSSVGQFLPTEAYWYHRPELQTLTLGVAALLGQLPDQMEAAFRTAIESVRAGNLELRNLAGTPLTAEWLMVAHYAPADLPDSIRGTLPILIH